MPIIEGFETLKNLPEEKISDKISRRVLTGEKGMVVWWSMKAGAHAAAHQHPHEQLFWVTSGAMDIRIGTSVACAGPATSASSREVSSTRRGFPRTAK